MQTGDRGSLNWVPVAICGRAVHNVAGLKRFCLCTDLACGEGQIPVTSRKDELRNELEILLGAARNLTPDTDAYLAERFVALLDRGRTAKAAWKRSVFRLRGRLAAVLIALALLATGGPLALHEYGNATTPSCAPTEVLGYPSLAVARANRALMDKLGYIQTGSRQQANGHELVVYAHEGGCTS